MGDSAKTSTNKDTKNTLKIHCQYDEDAEPEFLKKRGNLIQTEEAPHPVKKLNLENSVNFKKNWCDSSKSTNIKTIATTNRNTNIKTAETGKNYKKKYNASLEQMSPSEYEKYLKSFN